MINRPYICLSIRHLNLLDHISYNHRDMVKPDRHRPRFDVGEGVYSMLITNFKWPAGVTYPEMMEARSSVIQGLRNG